MTGDGEEQQHDQRWFDTARFGMFVHWDHASQQGLELSWPLVGGVFALPQTQQVTVEQYHSSAATFDPTAWDPKAIARAAREAGMVYVVFTAKHHSGYAMFHTKLSDFSVEHSPYGRDITRELFDALRDEGLKVGLYFSLSDWSHPDYPAFTEADKPYVFGASPPAPSPEQWDRYLDFMTSQLRELLTGYGRIDLVWFDGGWERPDWRAPELEQMIRELQPGIVINDRLPGAGDYATPEQFVPAQPPEGRWETCMTMNETWGYNPDDHHYKSSRRLVHTLCEVAGKGGNFLLNIGPRGDGSLAPEQAERLEAVTRWMQGHGESIVGTVPGLEPWQFYGPSTQRPGRVYLHLLMRPYESVDVRGVKVRRVTRVTDLGSGRELEFRTRTGIVESLLPDPDGTLTIKVPDEVVEDLATVIAIDIEDPA